LRIKCVTVANFRGIRKLDAPVELGDLSFFIGDNGTGKTSLLEAMNYCLSSSYVASRLDVNDFHNGNNEAIEVVVEFVQPLTVKIPDGFATQDVPCNKVLLRAKKRDRAAPGKAFSDLVTATQHFIPVAPRGEKGWSTRRKNGSVFDFDERALSLNNVDSDLPRVFYFAKSRVRQLSKGFNSSLSSIIDDLNWRFDRGQRKKTDAEHFKHQRQALHDIVFGETEGDTLKKTFDAANEILAKLGVGPIEVSLLKTLNPYDNSEIVFPFDGFELPAEHGGSGVEMLVSLALLEALAMLSRERLIILIDEPELHLHPKLQTKLIEHLTELSANVQIIASTHSPLLFKNGFQNPNAKLQITKRDMGAVAVEDAHGAGFGHLRWSPSWGEICYLAYDLPTVEFHDDLYGSLEDRFRGSPAKKTSQEDFDLWLAGHGYPVDVQWIGAKGEARSETLMTWIRNRIHHPENQFRPNYTEEQLTASINCMCDLLKKLG